MVLLSSVKFYQIINYGEVINSSSTSRGTPQIFGRNWGGVSKKWLLAYKSSNISEMWQDSTKVTIDNQQKILYALLIGAKINDLG